jgi:hypothetical protein
MNDVKKFLPTHLIPNDLILKMEKQKFFPGGGDLTKNLENKNIEINNNLNPVIDKYKDFFEILKDDLRKKMDSNLQLSQDINDIEEERQYYLDKINNVLIFARNKINSEETNPESIKILENLVKIITHIPEDFK